MLALLIIIEYNTVDCVTLSILSMYKQPNDEHECEEMLIWETFLPLDDFVK